MKLEERARKLRLILLDVDGVLTDGKLYYTGEGESIKVFDVRDGLGIKLLQAEKLIVGAISGRDSPALRERLRELNVTPAIFGEYRKLKAMEKILEELSIKPEETAFVGDDLPDLAPMQKVGFAIAVSNAHEIVKKFAHYVTSNKGGDGAVREIAELILTLRGSFEKTLKSFYA
ncbi:MAG: HAD-IIIA family hydrolase [Aquificaceae bacterium]